jgi:enterochelin esterase family protein
VAEGRIPPTAAVLLDNPTIVSRNTEYCCNEAFARFLVEEALPWARSETGATCPAERTVVAGVSLGGLAAMHAGWEHPDGFGCVVSLSGSFWWAPHLTPGAPPAGDDDAPEWLVTRISAEAPRPLRVYASVGRLEDLPPDSGSDTTQLLANRHLADALRGHGVPLQYEEFAGGHDFANWGECLGDGLAFVLDGTAAASQAPPQAHAGR